MYGGGSLEEQRQRSSFWWFGMIFHVFCIKRVGNLESRKQRNKVEGLKCVRKKKGKCSVKVRRKGGERRRKSSAHK